MANLTAQELTFIFLALAILIGTARILGELARALGQPSVLGEIAAGVLLGPTILKRIAPELQTLLFPLEGPVALVLEGIVAVSVVAFLLVAGLEVDLSVAIRQGKSAFNVASFGMLVPFVVGFAIAWFAPSLLMEVPEGSEFTFSLFFATALSISALPVVVKILKDLGLIKTDIGVIVVAAAILNDLVGWIIFAIVLGLIGTAKGSLSVYMVITLTLVFVVFMLTVGRWMIHKALVVAQAFLSWPAGVLSLSLSLALLCAAFTEWLGIHAIFGAFMFGVALGDSPRLRQQTRATLDHFISYTFAPIFFASIGLSVDFIGNFSLVPVIIVFVLASVCKISGCYLGAMLSGLSKRESLAIGCAKNARGAMEIILGLLALRYGLIDEKLFVALVIMALLTSMVSGTMVQAIIKKSKIGGLSEMLSLYLMEWNLKAASRQDAIKQMCALIAKKESLSPDDVFSAVWQREQIMGTGMERGVAVPHARMSNIKKPIIAVGRSESGVDFDGLDGKPAQLIFLILTPTDQPQSQLDILRAIGESLKSEKDVHSFVTAESSTEFLASLKVLEEQKAAAH